VSEVGRDTAEQAIVIFESRCKVCQSSHRHEIDAMLRRGDSQASVRRYANDHYGTDLTANNVSGHTRNHLYANTSIDWIQKNLRRRRVFGDPNVVSLPSRPEDALLRVIETGVRLMDAGATIPEPRDVIRAAAEIGRIEREQASASEEGLLLRISAFSEAVKLNVPESQFRKVWDDYRQILDGQ
jgi:hypothetical protein